MIFRILSLIPQDYTQKPCCEVTCIIYTQSEKFCFEPLLTTLELYNIYVYDKKGKFIDITLRSLYLCGSAKPYEIRYNTSIRYSMARRNDRKTGCWTAPVLVQAAGLFGKLESTFEQKSSSCFPAAAFRTLRTTFFESDPQLVPIPFSLHSMYRTKGLKKNVIILIFPLYLKYLVNQVKINILGYNRMAVYTTA